MTSGWMTVLPPSMMFWVPTSVALRATLLPVSVSMYSPLGGLREDMLDGYSALLVVLVVESSRVVCCLGLHHGVLRQDSANFQV
jgi:hypothetical protein